MGRHSKAPSVHAAYYAMGVALWLAVVGYMYGLLLLAAGDIR